MNMPPLTLLNENQLHLKLEKSNKALDQECSSQKSSSKYSSNKTIKKEPVIERPKSGKNKLNPNDIANPMIVIKPKMP